MIYRVALHRTEEEYSVSCPGLTGCWSEGETEDVALATIRDAITEYLAVLQPLRLFKCVLLFGLAVLFGGCGFDHEGALEHLGNNRERILDVRDGFKVLVPDSLAIKLEFRGHRSIDFGVFNMNIRPRSRDTTSVEVWSASLDDSEVQRGFEMLGWTEAELARVRELVESVDGIGIDGPFSDGGIQIRYRRHLMGMYSFVVTDSAMVAEGEVGYDGCSTYYLDTRTALRFGGPAFGSNCMPRPENW